MPILYEPFEFEEENTSERQTTQRKLSPDPSLRNYLIALGIGVVIGGIIVFGPTRSAVISAVAKGARVSSEKVEAWAAT